MRFRVVVLGAIFLASFLFAAGNIRAQSSQGQITSEKKFMVNKIRVVGSTLLAPDEIEKVLLPYEGKKEDLAALNKAASAITQLYRQKGYLLANAFVPPQTVQNGAVEIDVIEGRVENLDIVGNKAYSTAFIQWFLKPAIKKGFLDYNAFEKALMLLSSFPNLEIHSFLKPGAKPGTTDIVIEVKDSYPLHGQIDYNNYGNKFVGQNRAGAEIWDGNLTGHGDKIDFRGVKAFPSKEKPFYTASYLIPVTSSGMQVGASYANADIKVGGSLQVLDIRGNATIYGLTVAQPLARSSSFSSDITANLYYKNVANFVFATFPTSKDRLREVALSYDSQWTGSASKDLADVTITQGLGTLFGGMPKNDPLASRVGASDAFTKIDADYAHIQKFNFFNEDSTDFLILRGSGQLGFSPLAVTEEYSLGGPDTVRGYPQSFLLGDTGWSVSGEYRHPLTLDDSWIVVQSALFIDQGYVTIRHPLPGQGAKNYLTGAGVGIRLGFGPNYSASADLGFPLAPIKAGSEKLQPVLYGQFTALF